MARACPGGLARPARIYPNLARARADTAADRRAAAITRDRGCTTQARDLHSVPTRRRRRSEDALVAGAHDPEPAPGDRGEGRRRLAALLRAAGVLRSRREPAAGPGRRGADHSKRDD